MWGRALTIGSVVLAARLLTFPRTPWDAGELRWPFFLMVAISIAASVVTAVVLALREPMAALLFSLSAAVMVHAPTATWHSLSWMFLALAWVSWPRRWWPGLFLLAAAFPFLGIPEELTLPYEFSIARFTLHPWGSKFVFLPLLIAVIAGVRPALRRKELEPLAWFTLAYLAVGIAVVDPRDGVRYAVPAMLLVAIVAAEGLKALRVGWIGAALIAALSIGYAYPLLRERVTRPSPLAQALRARKPGLVFTRGDADAWGKLTRIPRTYSLPPPPGFTPGVGVYGVETNEAGESWRWLETYAELSAPRPLQLTLRLPSDAKIDFNDVRVNGTLVRVRRGESVTVHAPARVQIEAARTFPLDPPDTRSVAVQLR
jgi:hypothetical protein